MRLRIALLATLAPAVLAGQWTNRYPKNAGYAHQVYLEGYELPTMGSGPMDPAPAPDGRSLLIASRGWIWQLDLTSGVAHRITNGSGVDARPTWSPDGKRFAFVRDDGRTTSVVVRDVDGGAEQEIERGMALDPAFTPDGAGLVYSSLTPGGDLDLWSVTLQTGTKARLTAEPGLELRAQLHPDGERTLYVSKNRVGDNMVRLRRRGDAGPGQTLLTGNILSLIRPALSASGAEVAYNWPETEGWELRTMSLDRPSASTRLFGRRRGRPLTPAWSRDGQWIYFTEADSAQRFHLYRINRNGGSVTPVEVTSWDYGTPTGRVVVRTPGPARIHARDVAGHPLIPASGMVRFDGQNGLTYFYSSGTLQLEAPVGRVEIMAVQGLASAPVSVQVDVAAGATVEASLAPRALWDASANGWFAGDHHFHLNYGGQVDLVPADLLAPMRGEALDAGTPMLANLHNRFEDQEFFSVRSTAASPMIAFSQEVRAHFLGHIGLIGTSSLFWPWIWGPGYQMYGADDRLNAEPLAEGRRQGGLGIYVHPVSGSDPFSEAGLSSIPIALIPDAVHGAFDLLEIACLWSNEIGSTELWYRLLNAGLQVMPSAGTDAMTDLHRTMALGATRVYVRPEGPFTWESYMAGLRVGRSFVTTGPMLELELGGLRPGDVIPRGGREVPFTLAVHSAMPVDSVAIVVNGRTLWSGVPGRAPFSQTFRGSVRVPTGGWVGARVLGPAVDRWPAMASRVFAHTAPIWIGGRGTTDPVSRRAAVTDLERALANAEQRLVAGYAGAPIPVLKSYFGEARARLAEIGRR